ncbi:MAG TPA: CDC27 family protein [Candidatus Acidoferrum sp.]|nr:CDC27 family protein [Candidatus Acidoferrum sp.]
MYSLLLLAAFAALTIRILYRPVDQADLVISSKLGDKLERLWEIAHDSIREQHYLRAEKALLTILRVDERNATAYNRLGILYAKQRAYQNAIECFEIAQSLEPSASSLHNVGLIYYETGKFDRAALAFEQAIELESGLAARYIAYAKVQEKLGNGKKMIEALEKAVEIEPNIQSLSILADAYERGGDPILSAAIREKIEKMTKSPVPDKKIHQPRRVVM